MPKIIELTVELDVEKVSCPGVWLCQDGRVSLNIFALDTAYQTCLMPPIFPLLFKDVFYFRKRFQDMACCLNNMCCLLKDETIYCELVQWCNECGNDKCTVLAQYLGALNDVLFPPNMCTTEGIDLLMRRSSEFPGILSPKIEIMTKMRVDEVWASHGSAPPRPKKLPKPCKCSKTDYESARQKQVCHTPLYHRIRCSKRAESHSRSRPGSRSRSEASQSMCSVHATPDIDASCAYDSKKRGRQSMCGSPRQRFQVFAAHSPAAQDGWLAAATAGQHNDNRLGSKSEDEYSSQGLDEQTLERLILESQYIEQPSPEKRRKKPAACLKASREARTPCICEICRRYHELFHSRSS